MTAFDHLRRFDHALIDRVFQPLADRLGVLIRPQVLAESLLVGSAVMTVGQIASDLRAEGLDPGTILFGALNLLGAVWLVRWYRAHGTLSAGAANPFREMPVWMLFRVLGVADLGLSVLLPAVGVHDVGAGPLAVPLASEGQAAVFDAAASLLSTAGLYFAACRPPPPGHRRPARATPVAATKPGAA